MILHCPQICVLVRLWVVVFFNFYLTEITVIIDHTLIHDEPYSFKWNLFSQLKLSSTLSTRLTYRTNLLISSHHFSTAIHTFFLPTSILSDPLFCFQQHWLSYLLSSIFVHHSNHHFFWTFHPTHYPFLSFPQTAWSVCGCGWGALHSGQRKQRHTKTPTRRKGVWGVECDTYVVQCRGEWCSIVQCSVLMFVKCVGVHTE